MKRLLIVCVLLIPSIAQAQITTATPIVKATFEALSVKAPFTGNGANASAVVEYKASSSMTWITASDPNDQTPFIDLRATVNGSAAANPYANQARMSIISLSPNTSYDVRVTWTDPDGISGSNPVELDNTTTLNRNPTLAAGTCAATDDNSLNDCVKLGGSSAGTVTVAAGTYGPVTIARSGAAGAWIKLACAAGANITGGASQDMAVNGTNWLIDGCTFPNSLKSAVNVNASFVFVQNNTMSAVSSSTVPTDCPNNMGASIGYSNSGISVGGNTTDVYAFNNTITASTALDTCTAKPVSESPATGIFWASTQRNVSLQYVFCDNTVSGAFRDSITSDTASNYGENVDECRNTVSGYKDDGIESKGGNVNVRLWSNTSIVTSSGRNCEQTGLTSCDSATCIAANTISNSNGNQFGPLFIYRNNCIVRTTTSSGQTAYKIGGVRTYLIHNTSNSNATQTGSAARWDSIIDGSGGSSNVTGYTLTSLNNLIDNQGIAITGYANNSVFNYDFWRKTSATNFSRVNYPNNSPAANQASMTDLRASPLLLEVNSVCTVSGTQCTGVPGYLGDANTQTANLIDSTSPAANKGLALNMFNGSNTPWPFTTAQPSIGYFEANAGACTPDHALVTQQPAASTALNANVGTILVAIVNASGQTCTAATNTVTLSKHSGATFGTLAGTLTQSVSGGIATFNDITITTTAGIGSLDATPSGGLTLATTNTFTITSACVPAKLAFTSQPSNAAVGLPLGTIRVAVQDSGGNTCDADTSTVTLSKHAGTCTGMTLNGTVSGSATAGVFTTTNVNLTVTTGACSLDAADGALTGATSSPFTILNPTNPQAGRGRIMHH